MENMEIAFKDKIADWICTFLLSGVAHVQRRLIKLEENLWLKHIHNGREIKLNWTVIVVVFTSTPLLTVFI